MSRRFEMHSPAGELLGEGCEFTNGTVSAFVVGGASTLPFGAASMALVCEKFPGGEVRWIDEERASA